MTTTTNKIRTSQLAPPLILWCAIGGSVALAAAQSESPVDKINTEVARSEVKVQRLRGNVSVLMGAGGNIAVLSGPEGRLMVDAGIGISKAKLMTALDGLGKEPIKYLIDTHWHWDHTDGNPWVRQLGTEIIAHPNTVEHLANRTRVEEWNHTFDPLPVAARPTVMVKTEKTFHIDGQTVVTKYYGPAHTDGDLSVQFIEPDILVTGDTFWNGVYPFIDADTGGSIDGMIRAANTNVALASEKTIVVPGHGPVGNLAQLREYRDMLVAIRANVASLKKQGKSLEEVIAAKPTAAFDAKWGGFVIGPVFFTRLVYRGV